MPNPKHPAGGDPNIVRQGHTASTKFGTDPNMQQKGSKDTRDLTLPKSNG